MTKDVMFLLDSIHIPYCRPEYAPVTPLIGEPITHCNAFVAEVCETYAHVQMNGLLANDIIDLISTSPLWSEVPRERCQELANGGTLIVAGLKADPHGHVNVICPGIAKTSGRWGAVPSCANIGAQVFIGKGVNWAFADMPKFYAWRASL
jgi:hypothetical protein